MVGSACAFGLCGGGMFHVKHNRIRIAGEDIRNLAEAAGLALPPRAAEQLAAHAEMVLDVNKVMNLTRITESDDVVRLHILDSIAWLADFGTIEGPVVDIGSGSGFPGAAIEIMTGVPVLLCESVSKKASFLQGLQAALDLRGGVFVGRAEDLARERPEEFRTVTARALSSMPSLLELAAPLLMLQGRLIALKADPSSAELDWADRAAMKCGMSRPVRAAYAIPGAEVARSILVSTRTAPPQMRLPRRNGMAQKHPVG